jgi:hypothetical protein
MHNRKFNLTEILIGIIFIGGFIVAGAFEISGHPMSMQNPYACGGVCTVLLLIIFDSWKDNKKELLNRTILATPFVLLIVVLSILTLSKFNSTTIFHNNTIYYDFGMLSFFGLMARTNQLKRHYVITLATAVVCFIAIQIFVRSERSGWGVYIAFGCGLPAMVFYSAYCKRLYENSNVEIRPLAMESIKFAGAIFLLLVSFITALLLCDYYHLGYVIPFIISILLSLGFLGACKFFNIRDPAASGEPESRVKKTKRAGECECCGKIGLPQELLFKIDSGQRICAACLAKIDNT